MREDELSVKGVCVYCVSSYTRLRIYGKGVRTTYIYITADMRYLHVAWTTDQVYYRLSEYLSYIFTHAPRIQSCSEIGKAQRVRQHEQPLFTCIDESFSKRGRDRDR